MAKANKQILTWKFKNLRSGYEREGMLMAYWEVHLDPMSDDYTPQEVDARELFHKWEKTGLPGARQRVDSNLLVRPVRGGRSIRSHAFPVRAYCSPVS